MRNLRTQILNGTGLELRVRHRVEFEITFSEDMAECLATSIEMLTEYTPDDKHQDLKEFHKLLDEGLRNL